MRGKGGFKTGQAWCAYFVKAMWCSVLQGKHLITATKLMNGSAISTFNNLKADKSGLFEFSDEKIKPGGLIFWGNRTKTGGHVAICVENSAKGEMRIIEGNWNESVSAGNLTKHPKERVFTDANKKNLNYTFLGFINIKE